MKKDFQHLITFRFFLSVISTFFFVSQIFLTSSLGASKAKPHRKSSGGAQWAQVVIQGAQIYKGPSFDAVVLESLPFGLKVKVSKKAYPGAGGLGLFFKIKTKKGIIGYIVDTEIRLASAGPVSDVKEEDKEESDIYKEYNQFTPESTYPPIFLTRYMGGSFSYVNITEKFDGKSFQSFYPMYGFKATGPGVIFDGPNVDAEVLVGVGAPSFYDDFSSTDGFALVSSVLFLSGLADYESAMLYYGIGLMFTYSKMSVKLDGTNETLDSQVAKGGLAFSLGYAKRIKSWVMRIESKYYFEKEQYIGLGLSLQAPF